MRPSDNEIKEMLQFTIDNLYQIAIPQCEKVGKVTSLNRCAEKAQEMLDHLNKTK